MDYKKKYESVVDRLQGLIANGKKQGHIIVRIEDIENAIPELKESEDERIREGIKAALQFEFNDECRIAPGCDVTREEALEWLEKQNKVQ